MTPGHGMFTFQRDGMRRGGIEFHGWPLGTMACGIGTKRPVVITEFDIDMTSGTSVVSQKPMFMNKIGREVAGGFT